MFVYFASYPFFPEFLRAFRHGIVSFPAGLCREVRPDAVLGALWPVGDAMGVPLSGWSWCLEVKEHILVGNSGNFF